MTPLPFLFARGSTLLGLIAGIGVFAADGGLQEGETKCGYSATTGLAVVGKSEKIREAVAEWIQEEIETLESAGDTTKAEMLREDLEADINPVEIAEAHPALFPPIPQPEHNPLAKKALENIERLKKADPEAPRLSGGSEKAKRGNPYKLGQHALELTRAFAHPDSPMVGDPELVTPILDRLAVIFEHYDGGQWLGDFISTSANTETYLLLTTRYPNLLPPQLDAEWRAILRREADELVSLCQEKFNDPDYRSWVMADVRRMESLFYHSLIHDDPSYRSIAEKGLQKVAAAALPDGGFRYVDHQNPAYTYQGTNIVALARIAQVFDDPLARKLVVDSEWYFPLSIEPRGVAEYSTASSWTPYWNQNTGSDAALIVADWADSPENLQIVRSHPPKPTLWLAGFYRDDLKPDEPQDNYVLYDRNIEGARGRFGDFSFSATGRSYETDNRGKSTYVGAMAMLPGGEEWPEGAGTHWPLSAALQDVGSEVRHSEGGFSFRRSDTHYNLTSEERLETIVLPQVASLTAVYQLSKYRGEPQPWEGQQAWIMTPERMIGLVKLTSLEKQQAMNMAGTIKTVGGRNHWGVRNQWEEPEEGLFRYGHLDIRIRETDYPVIQTNYEDTYGGNTKKSGRISLLDRDPDGGEKTFAKGTSRYFVAEILPEWSKPAEHVSLETNEDGLDVLTVVERVGQGYILVQNATDRPIPWRSARDGATLWGATERHRPDWLGGGHSTEGEILREGQLVEVPAFGHVLIEVG